MEEGYGGGGGGREVGSPKRGAVGDSAGDMRERERAGWEIRSIVRGILQGICERERGQDGR